MKYYFIGSLSLILATLLGSFGDAIMKFLSNAGFSWYHFFAIGNTFAMIGLLIAMHFVGGIKKNLTFKQYNVPIFRGIIFSVLPIIGFLSLNNIPISIFTSLMMLAPLNVVILSYFILKEKIHYFSWIAVFFGFSGVLLFLQPSAGLNIFLLGPIIIALVNALCFVLIKKYNDLGSPIGYTFFLWIFPTLWSYIFFLTDPIIPSVNHGIIMICGCFFLLISIFLTNYAYHQARNYTQYISPYIYSQILWGGLIGVIYFKEKIDLLMLVGVLMIIFSGVITMKKQP